MKYGLLQITDINYSTIQTITGNMFSLTVNSEVEFNKEDRILGYWGTNPKKFIMVLEVAEQSTLTKVYLSKIFEIPSGVEIDNPEFQNKLNTGFSSGKTLLEISKDEYDKYERKLLSLIGVGKDIKKPLSKDIKHPHNRIIFGAPGTGKSYQLNEDAKVFGDNFERITFHPNYSYAQFVGTYKPIMKKNFNGNYEENEILKILLDGEKSADEKNSEIEKIFVEKNLPHKSAVPLLVGLYEKDGIDVNKVSFRTNEYVYAETISPLIKRINAKDMEEEITYSYVPGPFIRVLEKALYSQQIGENEPYLLIIEEINRANVAAVFGDVFQLLDRNENNESQYEIDVSEDLYNYLTSEDNEETVHKKLNIGKKIKIPSNMFIWATMNSADQGVQPMDAAFKRRWDFEYLDLNKNKNLIEKYELPFPKDEGYQLESWKKIRFNINELLSKAGNINEDKLLGPFFISENVLKKYNGKTDAKEAKEFADLFKSKVLMYLYEDVCKINPSQVFPKVKSKAGTGKAHFSDVCNEFDKNGTGVFEE